MSKRILHTLVLCLLLVSPCLAQELVQATSLGSVTLSELAKQKYPEPLSRDIEHEARWRNPERAENAMAVAWDLKPAAATIAAPPVLTRFSSVGSGSLTPGDASGAVGKNYVVTATNAGVIVHSRAGAQLGSVPLNVFLADTADTSGIYTDPRIAYDAGADRWIVFGLRYTNPMYPLIAVSQNGDPRGVWTRYRITSSQFLDIDFSRLALTRDTIVAVTYAFDGPSFVTSIKKSELYALPATLPVKIYTGPFNAVPVSGEESSIEYVLTDDGGTRIGIHRLDQLGTSPKLVQGAYPWGRAETRAPQLGTSLRRIDTGFLDIEAAVIRAGVLYAVNATALSSPTRTSILWWKIDPESGKYLGGGMIDDPTGNKYYAYPSIAVNRAGGIMIGFSTFTPAQYPSAGYVYIDPLGAISNEGVLKAGESVTTSNRWGDYSTTVVDPLDDATFWTIQEAAAENHWVAWWGKMTIKAKARSARH